MGKKPARRKGARRLNITPELKADVRRRYEHTPERLAPMAADCGCCNETIRAMARRERWVRFEPPPRDLSPAARLRMKAEALASYPPPCGEGGERSEPGGGPSVSTTTTPTPDPSPQGGGEKKEGGGEEKNAATARDAAVIAARMLHEVSGFLDDIRAKRKRMKREGYPKHELQAVSRIIADCSAALQRLQLTAHRAAAAGNAQHTDPETAQENPYDDMPADLDEFRNELARRIRLFVEAQCARRDGGEPGADDAAAPAS